MLIKKKIINLIERNFLALSIFLVISFAPAFAYQVVDSETDCVKIFMNETYTRYDCGGNKNTSKEKYVDCSTIQNKTVLANCELEISKMAVARRDIQGCYKISDKQDSNSCINSIAIETHNYNVCLDMKEKNQSIGYYNKDNCLQGFLAEEWKHNKFIEYSLDLKYKICSLMDDISEKEMCIVRYTGEKLELEDCAEFKYDEQKEDCFLVVIRKYTDKGVFNDTSICENVEKNLGKQDACRSYIFEGMAKTEIDPDKVMELCEKKGDEIRNRCALNKLYPKEYCEYYRQERIDECFLNSAKEKLDERYCERIERMDMKDRCYNIYSNPNNYNIVKIF